MDAPCLKVFISDDSEMIRGRLANFLLGTVRGIEIVGDAANSVETVSRIGALSPDVAILDLWMGERNNLEVLTKLRRSQPGLFLMVLTNDASPPVRDKCLALGADCFFDKSTEFENARDVLRDLVGMRAGKIAEPAFLSGQRA